MKEKQAKKKLSFALLSSTMITVIIALGVWFYVQSNEHQEPEIGQIIISETEAADLKSFYEINPESISKGEYFDVKYAYLNPERVESIYDSIGENDIYIEVVKKDNRPIRICNTWYQDKIRSFRWGAEHAQKEDEAFMSFEGVMDLPIYKRIFIPIREEYKKISYDTQINRSLLMHTQSVKPYSTKPGHDKYDLTELFVGYDVREGSSNGECIQEDHHLKYDAKQRIPALEEIKERCMTSECSIYEKRYVSYYFGVLLKEDFDRWYVELKTYLQEVDIRSYPHAYIMTDYIDFGEEPDDLAERKKTLNLSDEQYEKYLELIELS